MMLRLCALVGALLLVLSGVLSVSSVGAGRARPYDPDPLTTFLTPPEGCEAPCWIGIRPGETTLAEAFVLLGNHDWISGVALSGNIGYTGGTERLNWRFSDDLPVPVADASASYLTAREGVVDIIYLQTTLNFGDAWMVLGEPQGGYLAPSFNVQGDVIIQEATYAGGGLAVRSTALCPMTPAEFWNSTITIELRDPSLYMLRDEYDLTRRFVAYCY